MTDQLAKRITVAEAMSLAVDPRINRHVPEAGKLGGFLTMTDNTGRVIFRNRPNIVVLRGRTFALERLFASSIGSQGVNGGVVPYISDINRQVIAFGVGKGGAPSGDPFSPYAPPPTGAPGVALAQAVPFRFHDTSQSGSGDPTLFIPGADIGDYGNRASVPSGTPTQFYYWLKNFDVLDPAWFFSETANTVYKSVMLSISVDDCRTGTSPLVNELALYFGRLGTSDPSGGCVFTSPEMFSRITFPTEFMTSGKDLSVEYRIYA